jgi:hypothetical protein
MSALHKNAAIPTHHAGHEGIASAYEARDMVRDHLTTSLALCDDVLARCEQMKAATRKP